MGGRQSKRSVDITTTPKKEGIPAEGGVVGDAAAPGDGKLEKIEETDTKPTTNGIALHTDVPEDKDKDKDDATEKDKEKQPEEVTSEESKQETKEEASGESPVETAEVTTPTEATATSPSTATSPDSKETKKKEKAKKKWSFRSISFSKKDKTKPSREETPKNGDVTKEEPLAEGGEEAENASGAGASPADEKSVSSPSGEKETPAESASEGKDEGSATPATNSPADEKKEEPTPSAPTPVPVEEKKEEVEKVDAEKKVVEVSRAGGQSIADPVEVFRVQPVATPSIIERKTSEDIPSLPPSSPPPTPIDPSPLQQAQQAQATVKALAEALKIPAEAAHQDPSSIIPEIVSEIKSSSSESNQSETKIPGESSSVPLSSSVDEAPVQIICAPRKVEALPVVDQEKEEISSPKGDQDPLKLVDTVAKSTDTVKLETHLPTLSDTKCTENVEIEVSQPVSKSHVGNEVKEEIKQSEDFKMVDVAVEPAIDEKLQKSVETMHSEVKEEPEVIETVEEATSIQTAESTILDVTKPEVAEVVGKEEAEVIETVIQEIPQAEVISQPEKVIEPILEIVEEVVDDVKSVEEVVEGVKVVEVAEDAEVLEEVEKKAKVVEEVAKDAKLVEEVAKDAKLVEEVAKDAKLVEEVAKDAKLVEEVAKDAKLVEEVAKDAKLAEEVVEDVKVVEEVAEDVKVVVEVAEDVKVVEADVKSVEEEIVIEPIESTAELVIETEEGPIPISEEEIVVEAKPAVVIPEEELTEEVADTDADVSKLDTESIEVIELAEEKVDNEMASDAAISAEEILVSDEVEDISAANTGESGQLVEETIVVVEDTVSGTKDVIEIVEIDDTLPLPTEEPSEQNLKEISKETEPITVPSPHVNVEEIPATCVPSKQSSQDVKKSLVNEEEKSEETRICEEPLPEPPLPPPTSDSNLATESLKESSSPRLEELSVSSEDLPPAPVEALDLPAPPLPPEELSSPLPPRNVSELKTELPVPDECSREMRNPTETLLTPPRSPSPSPQSNIDIVSDTRTPGKESSQTVLCEGERNRESKMESMSIKPNSYNDSEIELKGRLAETEKEIKNEEESSSCQLSNSATSTAAKESHQSTPEAEAPVENNVTHEVSTTESLDEAPKVAPPAVPAAEVPASPPSAPAITEDVASVTKAVEEIEISDKAVAAATIDCNTVEIIADAPHQNNINE